MEAKMLSWDPRSWFRPQMQTDHVALRWDHDLDNYLKVNQGWALVFMYHCLSPEDPTPNLLNPLRSTQWSSGRVWVQSPSGSYPRHKNGSHCLPAWHPVFRVWIGGLDHSVIPGRGSAAVHRSLRGWVKRRGNILHRSGCDNHCHFNSNFNSAVAMYAFGAVRGLWIRKSAVLRLWIGLIKRLC